MALCAIVSNCQNNVTQQHYPGKDLVNFHVRLAILPFICEGPFTHYNYITTCIQLGFWGRKMTANTTVPVHQFIWQNLKCDIDLYTHLSEYIRQDKNPIQPVV
jgi:hypothetical protein